MNLIPNPYFGFKFLMWINLLSLDSHWISIINELACQDTLCCIDRTFLFKIKVHIKLYSVTIFWNLIIFSLELEAVIFVLLLTFLTFLERAFLYILIVFIYIYYPFFFGLSFPLAIQKANTCTIFRYNVAGNTNGKQIMSQSTSRDLFLLEMCRFPVAWPCKWVL